MAPFVFTSNRDITCVLARMKVESEPLEKMLVYHDIFTGNGGIETVNRF